MGVKKLVPGNILITNLQNTQKKQEVILLCEHSDYGSFGLTINKAFDDSVLQGELEILKDLSLHPKVSFRCGGDVEPLQMMCVHETSQPKDYMLHIYQNVYLGGDILFLEEVLLREDCPELLIFFGYRAWIGGQLDNEAAEQRYLVLPSCHELLFNTPMENIYKTAASKLGRGFEFFSRIPKDLSLN